MKVLLLLFFALPAMALPSLEEVRASLGSANAKERTATTLEIWKSGAEALPLLREVSKDSDPEVARRAHFILRRLQMGLTPKSPKDLLGLAETLEQTMPDERASHLIKLLAHAEGAPVALTLLDQWASREIDQPERLLTHARLVTEAVLEQRSHWQNFFTTKLSPQCRAALLVEVAKQDLPMKAQITAILSRKKIAETYASLKKLTQKIDNQTALTLARVAITENNVPLALRILSETLATANNPDLARALAYLEASSDTPILRHEGSWKNELKVFQARLQQNKNAVHRFNQKLTKQQFLQYENLLISGHLALPSENEEHSSIPSEDALRALHSAFGDPPTEPDIEALSAEILIDWTVLARTLTLLGSPIEAAETLSSNGQATSAVGLLWRTKHREEALTLARETLNNFDQQEEAKMRLTLTSLYLDSGEKEAAREYFEPLIYLGNLRESYRKKAVSLGLQLYPREQLFPLAPDINSKQAYKRAPAIAYFLSYPDKVAAFWFEYFLAQDEFQSPATLCKKVENFLSGNQKEAREIISQKLTKSSKKILLPGDALYQNALFLQLPQALEMVSKAAWYQLSTKDLLSIVRNESWPKKSRDEALKTALLIDPTNPSLQWHNLGKKKDLENLHHLTLGDASLTLQLGALTGKRNTLKLAVEVADLRDFNALRCLTILAKSYLKNNEPAKAARLLQAALCGEVAAGNHPTTPIQATLDNLADYLKARSTLAKDEDTKKHWQRQLRSIQ